MNIAVTGGTGFLGRYVIDYLLGEGQTPIVLTRNIHNNVDVGNRVTDYSKNNLIDKLKGIDAVIHLAAKRGSQDQICDFHDNEVITQNLYEACKENKITNIVFASTISVYSDVTQLPWTENQLPSPILMYAVSKLSNEYIGTIYSEKYGLHIKNLRLAHLFGFNEANDYMINRFLRQASRQEQLVLDSSGTSKREFLYAKDAAKAIGCALREKYVSGTFNIGSNEALTNYEVAAIINTAFNNVGNLIVKNPNAKEAINSSFLRSEKAKILLHYSPDYTFSSAVNEIYERMKGIETKY